MIDPFLWQDVALLLMSGFLFGLTASFWVALKLTLRVFRILYREGRITIPQPNGYSISILLLKPASETETEGKP